MPKAHLVTKQSQKPRVFGPGYENCSVAKLFDFNGNRMAFLVLGGDGLVGKKPMETLVAFCAGNETYVEALDWQGGKIDPEPLMQLSQVARKNDPRLY